MKTEHTPTWINAVNNGATTLCKLFDNQGNQIAEVRCLQGHREEILNAWDAVNHFDAMKKALEKFMSWLDDGVLVRDITKDHQSDWAMRMMHFVNDLNKAKAVLAAIEQEEARHV